MDPQFNSWAGQQPGRPHQYRAAALPWQPRSQMQTATGTMSSRSRAAAL